LKEGFTRIDFENNGSGGEGRLIPVLLTVAQRWRGERYGWLFLPRLNW